MAEAEDIGVRARQHFYEGTKALKSANFPAAVEEYRKGLGDWDQLLKKPEYKTFRDDDLNQKETRHLVSRYMRALKQIGEKEPDEYPFKDMTNKLNEEFNPDPFDQLEMIRTSGTTVTNPARSKPSPK
jgi:hypothetical protein